MFRRISLISLVQLICPVPLLVPIDEHKFSPIDEHIFFFPFMTKAACCRNMEIVLHPTTLSYIFIYIYIKFTEASHHNTLNMTQNRWM